MAGSPVRPGDVGAADAPAAHDEADPDTAATKKKRKSFGIYALLLVAFLAVQFGHGSNIGVAVSLPGGSKAMNLALGSWVNLGVVVGLPLTPWACRTFGVFRVCSICFIVDFLAILLMLWPGISLHQMYAVRFMVGFFEAPFLPYLQEWLARFGKHTWNVWNTVLHAMVPLGENLGYIVAQELVKVGYSWQWAFAGQAALLAVTVTLCCLYGGRTYLDLSHEKSQVFVDGDDRCNHLNPPSKEMATLGQGHGECGGTLDGDCESSVLDEPVGNSEVEYPVTEKWAVYWATNCSLAAQLGFLSASKYVIRDYGRLRGFSVHCVIFAFSAIALVGPALGGSIVMSGSIIRPDQWSQHKKTLFFLACTSGLAACIAAVLPYTPESAFWPALFACFVAAGGVYPAAQGIINIALTATRVIDASVYQVQCNNILFAMPLPYVIGKCMDVWGIETSFKAVTLLQLATPAGFALALMAAACTEERSAWHRLLCPQEAEDGNSMT